MDNTSSSYCNPAFPAIELAAKAGIIFSPSVLENPAPYTNFGAKSDDIGGFWDESLLFGRLHRQYRPGSLHGVEKFLIGLSIKRGVNGEQLKGINMQAGFHDDRSGQERFGLRLSAVLRVSPQFELRLK